MGTALKMACVMAAGLILVGCTAAQHRQSVEDDSGDRMTVGTVQRQIQVGMSGAEVAAVLGSPNIVTTDEDRREVWVYDKISTTSAYSSSSGGVSTLFLGPVGALFAAAGGSVNASSGASSTSQRTLTVIIKFDKEGRVRDFAYHTSRF